MDIAGKWPPRRFGHKSKQTKFCLAFVYPAEGRTYVLFMYVKMTLDSNDGTNMNQQDESLSK